ncbi:MAG: RNA polymerase sigma factor SigJ [Gemmatimonadaceae bacterium]
MTARPHNSGSPHDGIGDHHGINDHRPRLLGLAYRMLGDVDEAEDVVQEAFLRWQLTDQQAVRSPEAWLMTVVTRLSLDRLRRLQTERSTYPGPWLPEPVATDPALAPASSPAPDGAAELASDLSVALLLLLERLTPDERAAFLLREVFDAEYAEIADILQRSSDAIRQMVHRARARVRTERTRVVAPPGEHERILERFMDALSADDAPALLALLAPDVVLASDGGGRVRAARRWLVGPERVARFILGVARKFGWGFSRRLSQLNGRPAMLVFNDGVLVSATIADVEGERIRALHIIRNPDKLRHALDATVRLV